MNMTIHTRQRSLRVSRVAGVVETKWTKSGTATPQRKVLAMYPANVGPAFPSEPCAVGERRGRKRT